MDGLGRGGRPAVPAVPAVPDVPWPGGVAQAVGGLPQTGGHSDIKRQRKPTSSP